MGSPVRHQSFGEVSQDAFNDLHPLIADYLIDTVILLDCIDEILPSARYIGSPEDNEDVRCMYVAVTRAKNTLYMIVPKIVLKYGKAIPGYLSRYIEDKEDLYDFCNVKENILEF